VNTMARRPPSPQELKALRFVRNHIVHFRRAPSIRDVQRELGYSSPRSAAKLLEQLESLGLLKRRADKQLQVLRGLPEDRTHARTVLVPLVGSAPCGAPLLAEQNVEAMIPVSIGIARPPARYFLLRAQGDSMNLAGIDDGNLVLVRQQAIAENGDRVVALIDDEATIKEFRRTTEAVALLPRSRNKQHTPIYLTTNFQIQGVVKATLPRWEEG
jgi:repressor LexA